MLDTILFSEESLCRLASLCTLRNVRFFHPEASSELKADRYVDSDPAGLSGNVNLKSRLGLSLRAPGLLCPANLRKEPSSKPSDEPAECGDLNLDCEIEARPL